MKSWQFIIFFQYSVIFFSSWIIFDTKTYLCTLTNRNNEYNMYVILNCHLYLKKKKKRTSKRTTYDKIYRNLCVLFVVYVHFYIVLIVFLKIIHFRYIFCNVFFSRAEWLYGGWYSWRDWVSSNLCYNWLYGVQKD